jgi:hypothetical protein
MNKKDEELLAEAYEQILEGKFGTAIRSLGAAAALAGSAHGADMDTVNKDYHLDKKPEVVHTGVNPYVALNKAMRGEELTPHEVSAISNDQEYSAKYIQHLVNHNSPVPEILKKKYPEVIQRTKALARQSGSGG